MYEKILAMMNNQELNKKDQWINLTEAEQNAWLVIACTSSTKNRPPDRSRTVEIEGRNITSASSFYCALGEAVNGPGGYFGRDLDGLSDCFCGDFGVALPFTLTWKNHTISKAAMDEEYYNLILTVLEEAGATVVLE